jgi:hypothetical protein
MKKRSTLVVVTLACLTLPAKAANDEDATFYTEYIPKG